MSLASSSVIALLTSDRIQVNADIDSRDALFQEVGTLFANEQLSTAEIVRALKTRETLGSTALGQGVAIPHGRIKGLPEAQAAFIRPTQPIAFNAPDGKKVNLFFILLVPAQATERHLQLLAELAQMTSSRKFREALCAAPGAAAVCALLRQQVEVGD